jgi:hypothetical protein
MRRWALAAALAAAAWPAWAQPGSQQQLGTHQSRVLDAAGAIAAFAVDPTIVDVSVEAGRVVLLGRRGGDTVVTVVLAGSVESFRVHVDPPVIEPDVRTLESSARTVLEGRYDSALHRFTGVVTGRGRVGDSEVRVHAEAVRQSPPVDGEAPTALPAASVEIVNAQRSIVLLDKFVQDSPLTLDGVVLRGVHVQQGEWDVHAGIASWSPLEGFLSKGGERAVTVARSFGMGTMRVTPRVAWFPDARGGTKSVGAVSIEFGGGKTQPLHVRAEAGLSGGPGVAVEADYRTQQRDAWLRATSRPQDFAALNAGPPPGTQAEGAWTEQLNAATSVSVSGSASALKFEQTDTHSATARAELRRQLGEHWNASLMASGGDFRASGGEALRRTTVGTGVGWDSPQWGVSGQYRWQTNSLSDQGGQGGRVSVRANMDGWRASGFVDVQQQAPTLDLVLGNRSDLARTLAGLGIVAAQPEDILHALHDNASLITGQGTVIGPVRLNPLRTYAGADLSWRGRGAARPEIGVRVLRDHVEGVVGARSSSVASLHAGWRVNDNTDVGVALSRWVTQSAGQEKMGETGVQVNVRTFLDRPLIAPGSSAPITGQVFRGDDAQHLPLAGIDVVLDRNRRTRTDSDGRFEFDRPGTGSHSVEAVLPAQGSAYFTTPSMVTREPGGKADFGIALAGVRVTGAVRNDAGLPVPGVAVRAEGGSTASALTDSDGMYRLTVAPGDVQVSIAPESVPAGHDLRALAPRKRKLESGQPATVNFVLRTMRSLEGVVAGAAGRPVTVTVVELGRSVTTDANGRFIMRGLPAGQLTFVVGDGTATRVDMPERAGVVRGVTLQAR